MSVYAIAQGRIDDRKAFERYVELATPTLQTHNARILAVDEAPTSIEGTIDYPRTVILEFDSADAFHAWYDSPEYVAARQHRIAASAGRFILVTGLT
jgi:uncharacterized protein (DUF1330 family)